MTWLAFAPLLAYVALVVIVTGTLAKWLGRKPVRELTRHTGNAAALEAYEKRVEALGEGRVRNVRVLPPEEQPCAD